MKYLLDTCVISDFIKGETNTLHRLKNISPTEIAISTITIMEIEYGLALNPKLTKKIKPVILDLLTVVHVLDFESNDAIQTAMTRALLKQQGNPIGSYDILLAGTALSKKLIMVTSNINEFNKIPGLKIENWRQP